MIFTWHWPLHDIDLYMTMIFTWQWPSHVIDRHMTLTFTWHWPLHDIDLNMTLIFTWHWPSHDNDIHMTLTFIQHWHWEDLDCEPLRYNSKNLTVKRWNPQILLFSCMIWAISLPCMDIFFLFLMSVWTMAWKTETLLVDIFPVIGCFSLGCPFIFKHVMLFL